MNLTLQELKAFVAEITGHPLTDTNVTQVEQTAQGVVIHVDQPELREQLADAQLELAELRSDLVRVLAEHPGSLTDLRDAILRLIEE